MKKAQLLAGFVILLAGNAALSGQPLSPGQKVLPHDQQATVVNGSHEDPLYLNYGSPAFNHPSYYYAALAVPPSGVIYRQAGLRADGTKIIAQKSFTEGSFNRTEIVLMDADGTDEIIISAGNSGEGDIYGYMNPFWSDDGNYIGFCEVHYANYNKVMRYQLSTSTTEYIYEPVDNDVANPDFLGTSITSIVFWAYGPAGGADFFTWDGTTLTNITNTANYKEYEPVSNPDGTKILFWSGETTEEPVNTTHTLTYSGGIWTKDVGFTPIPDTYWSYWTDNNCDEIGTVVYSTNDINIYSNTGTFILDLTGPGYSGGSGQWNFFGSGIKGPNGEMLINSKAGRTEPGRDIVMANPRAKLFVDDNGSDAYPGTVNAPFATIGKGIAESVAGGTVNVASGTYNENITVNKFVTLDGAGNLPDPAVNTVVNGNGNITVIITGSGTGDTERLTLKDMYITGGTRGINVANNASYLKLDHVSANLNSSYGINFDGALNNEVLITYCQFNQNGVPGVSGVGLRLQSTSKVHNLDIDHSEFNNNYQGIYAGDGGAFYQTNIQLDQINITQSTFDGNTIKGIYVESMSNALFDNITLNNNGSLATYNFGAGIDINLKFNNYSNITIQNSPVTNCGIGSLYGVGITIKARDDGGYASPPATLNNVILDNLSFSGNKTCLTFGEPGKDNNGPTGVVIKNCSFSGSTSSDINNNSKSSIDALLNNTFTGAADNYAIEDRIFHKLDNSVKGLVNWMNGNVYVTTNSGSIQRGIDASGAGWNVNVAAGTFHERLSISKSLTIKGAQFGVDPTGSGARTNPGEETIIDLVGLSVNNPNILIDIPSGVSNVIIDGFTLNGSTVSHYADESTIRAWDDYITISNNIMDGYQTIVYKGNDHSSFTRNRIQASKDCIVVQPNAATDLSILENSLSPNSTPASGGQGIYLTGVNTGNLSDNSITGFNTSNGLGGSNLSQLDITGNDFTGNTNGINIWGTTTFLDINDNVFSSNITVGIKIKGDDINIIGNEFSNNGAGIIIDKHVLNTERIEIHENIINGSTGYALEVKSAVVMQVDAEENYWGVVAPDEVAVKISGNADYDPWCNADLSVCGFTETSNIYNENQETYFLTVQDAINAASIGDVIEITGTHNVKNLVVNKGLKIAAAAGGAHFSGLDASRSGTGVVVTDDARITGITFSDYDIAVDIQSGAASIANCTFYNNVIAVKNLADNPVADADSCFWGDPTGPFDNSPAGLYNPLGVGDEVTDYVGYQPWYNDIDHTLLPVDIKITNPSCNTLNVYLKSNQAFAGNLTNIQFAVKWDATVYNGIVTPTFKYGSAGEGYIDLVKYENNGGSKYAVFVYYGGIASNWAEGGEVLILTLELDESGAMYNTTGFEIAQDAFVSGANENYYIQLDGDDRTGYIYGFAEDVYTATCDMPLDAKVFLQGPYDMYTDLMKTDLAGVIPTGAYPAGRQPFTGNPWLYNGTENLGSVPAGMVDWVLVELRTGTGAGTMAYRQAGLLFSDGTIRSAADPAKDIFFASDPTDLMPNSDFYIVVYHRNHMPVMSGAPVNIPNSAMLNLTDLTQAYGYVPASAVEQPLITLETGVYGMIAGDHYGAIPAGEGWNYFDYPDGWLYYSGNPNDRDPILAKIVSVTGLPYINGVINNVYFKEDLTMNKQVKYSGSGNDPRLIIQNLIELKGSNVLTNFYESKVPGWAIPHVKKEGLLSMTGPLDIGLYEAPRELLINITANETFTGAVVSNIQFTLCWDESNAEAGRLIAGYQGDFLLEPQGDPVKFAGKMYQVFATVEPVALPDPLNSGEQVTVLRFANSDAAPVAANGLAIADNAWTLANNGGYYIAVWGAGQTGRIVTGALGTDQPGDSGPVVRIYPNPTATGWIYLTTNPAVSGNLAVRLTDLTGRQLRQSQWSVKSGTANAMTFDLEGLSHGAYLLNINGESFSFSERIIIR